MVARAINSKPFRINRFSRDPDRAGNLRYFYAASPIFIPGAFLYWFNSAVSCRLIWAAASQNHHFCPRSLFSRPQCVVPPGTLPPRTETDSFLGSSRPSCVPAASPAAPRRARDVTSREVSRCYVAPPHHVIARGRRGRQS